MNQFYQRLIKASHSFRSHSLTKRTTAITGITLTALYLKNLTQEEAPEIVKAFCYEQAGRRDFKIKTDVGPKTSFAALGNTLFVPNGYGSECLETVLIDKQQLEIEQQNYINMDGLVQEKQHIDQAIKSQKTNLKELSRDKQRDLLLESMELTKLHIRQLQLTEQLQPKIDNEVKIKRNNSTLNLFKGILDHEIGHITHHDTYRIVAVFGIAFIAMEWVGGALLSQLETHFEKNPLDPTRFKNKASISACRLTSLAIPTAIYLGAFFVVQQYTQKIIEVQADATIRDDLPILKAMKKHYRKRAALDKVPQSNTQQISCTLKGFFARHPSDEKRADYFAKRVEQNATLKSP